MARYFKSGGILYLEKTELMMLNLDWLLFLSFSKPQVFFLTYSFANCKAVGFKSKPGRLRTGSCEIIVLLSVTIVLLSVTFFVPLSDPF